MDAGVRQATWTRNPRVTLSRMTLVWVGPPSVYFLLSGLAEPGPDGGSGKYDLRHTAIVAAASAVYAALLAVPDHLLARRGRTPVVAVHVGFAAFATAVFGAFFAVHTWVAVVAVLFLMAMAAALAFAGVVLLNLIAGSFPPSLPQVSDGSASALPSGSALN